ncbi:MAG: sulfatase-like hydrolase/transferase [Salibacteraceae bacterium]
MKRKINLFASVILIATLAWFGLKPMTSGEWTINPDSNRLSHKLEYLKKLSLPDSAAKMNVVIIMADDLGKMDVSTYGGTTMQTPEIDKLASEGVTFTDGYVTSPICSPSRAGLLTGRNQARFGYDNNVHERYPKNFIEQFFFKHFLATEQWQVADAPSVPEKEEMEKQGISPDEILISEVLHRVGYRTGILGKWHLGYNDMSLPINRGFDYHYGFYEAFSLYQSDLENENVVNQKCPDFSDPFIWEKGRTGTCAIRKNHIEIEEEGYLTDRIADEAEEFIKTNKDTSFFLYVAFNAPHTPFQAQKKYYDMYSHIEDPYKRVYYAMIKNLDDAIGRINESIKSAGLEENTLVVFLSDNGGALYTMATDNAPLKGGKMTHFEGGINIPFSMKLPGLIDSNITYSQPVVATDIFGTITDLVGIKNADDRTYDCVSLLPFVNNNQLGTPHESIFWRADYLRSVRKGDWKLIEDRLGGQKVLYNLASDKYEKTNVYDANLKLANELTQALDNWENDCQKPMWPRVMDFKFNDGKNDYYFPL